MPIVDMSTFLQNINEKVMSKSKWQQKRVLQNTKPFSFAGLMAAEGEVDKKTARQGSKVFMKELTRT